MQTNIHGNNKKYIIGIILHSANGSDHITANDQLLFTQRHEIRCKTTAKTTADKEANTSSSGQQELRKTNLKMFSTAIGRTTDLNVSLKLQKTPKASIQNVTFAYCTALHWMHEKSQCLSQRPHAQHWRRRLREALTRAESSHSSSSEVPLHLNPCMWSCPPKHDYHCNCQRFDQSQTI